SFRSTLSAPLLAKTMAGNNTNRTQQQFRRTAMTQPTTTATNNAQPRGLRLSVYRPAGYPDCTNNGISARHDVVTVVGFVSKDDEKENALSRRDDIIQRYVITALPKGSQVFAATDDAPAVILRYCAGNSGKLHLAPADDAVGGTWLMAGGNYAASSDSRWSALVRHLTEATAASEAIQIHDRIEN
ncbi:hypothetical protein, partial [Gordonia sp. (in: high G+C Gram-positive bacteria)]|uniref:hypothetical protein n=1 Tax=Gordonia sp. (in: high G+C Gram-positive bacteria) TaxID=84139 RepID=UPI003C72C103